MASLPETLHVRVKQKMAGVYIYEGRDPWLRCIFLVSSPAMLSQIRGHSFTFLLNCRFYRSLETIQRSLLSVYFPANKKRDRSRVLRDVTRKSRFDTKRAERVSIANLTAEIS